MPRFLSTASEQIENFTSQLLRRATVDYDSYAEHNPPRGWFSSWFKHATLPSSITLTEDTRRRLGAKNGRKKLGTFTGVFIPTTMNIVSIITFLRFGFILGQAGLLGILGMLLVAYSTDLLTVMSISAVATNGTVRGGGAYYMISRSLGPEFGGSIGLLFYLGTLLNAGMNCVGTIEPLLANFGETTGETAGVLPEGRWWSFLYSTVLLLFCTIVCCIGARIFTKASDLLFCVICITGSSIPLSAILKRPFFDDSQGIEFTGLSWYTLRGNLFPHFTSGSAGSQLRKRESLNNIFGILFSACAGIFAGASMSGELKHPSKAIPKGTLYGLLATFLFYVVVILSLATTVTRQSLYNDVHILQDVNISKYFVLIGELSVSISSSLLGLLTSAKLLQAISRYFCLVIKMLISSDGLLPFLRPFSQGTEKGDEPTFAILLTYVLIQITLLADINMIANFVTIFFLLTFFVTNLACFALRIGAAPNFRPRFRYFNGYTAAVGGVASVAMMFFVDQIVTFASLGVFVLLFFVIHYASPPKSWGDVSQSLLYFGLRKYLLRLRQDHVKFWRPQGALYILGHAIVCDDFSMVVAESKRQNKAWNKFRESAGLGGMRPNIVVMGFFNMQEYRKSRPLIDAPAPNNEGKGHVKTGACTVEIGQLPTDENRSEEAVKLCDWVEILEDLLLSIEINVAVAQSFKDLQLPRKVARGTSDKKYIDLWPIQMTAEIEKESGSVYATNFDTYTLILQLGCILHTVPAWHQSYELRVMVFTEHEKDAKEEEKRVETLLSNLRIPAKLRVLWLDHGRLSSYDTIVNGSKKADERALSLLNEDAWWQELCKARWRQESKRGISEIVLTPERASTSSASQRGETCAVDEQNGQNILSGRASRSAKPKAYQRKRRHTVSDMHKMGVSPSVYINLQKPLKEQSHDTSDSEVDFSDYDDDDITAAQPSSPQIKWDPAFVGDGPSEIRFQKTRDEPRRSSVPSSANKQMSPVFSGSTMPTTEVTGDDTAEDAPADRTISFAEDPQRHLELQQKAEHGIRVEELSFNDCSSRAQYLIINELMRQNTEETAVLLTTLPAPPMGAHKTEEASMEYVSGLELLCDALPPTLLVHSKSMTVTMAL